MSWSKQILIQENWSLAIPFSDKQQHNGKGQRAQTTELKVYTGFSSCSKTIEQTGTRKRESITRVYLKSKPSTDKFQIR